MMEIPYTFAGVTPLTLQKSRAAVLPVAYEATTSYLPGTRFGPQEIILASRFLESYEQGLEYQPADLGITTLPELWPNLASPQKSLREITTAVGRILKKGVFPVVLGGEHTITYAAVNAHLKHRNDFSLLILDAHADLRNNYQGTAYNHACNTRRCLELNLPVTTMGVRSLSREEAAFPLNKKAGPRVPGARERLQVITADALKKSRNWVALMEPPPGDNIYLSVDMDFFDPAFVPAVGTPEPGGFGWEEAVSFLERLTAKHRLIGFDVVELNGGLHHAPSAYFAARLAYYLLGRALLHSD